LVAQATAKRRCFACLTLLDIIADLDQALA
jgi:hypothetical protein